MTGKFAVENFSADSSPPGPCGEMFSARIFTAWSNIEKFSCKCAENLTDAFLIIFIC